MDSVTFECDICGKSGYKTKGAVKRHQRRSKICQAAAKITTSDLPTLLAQLRQHSRSTSPQ